MRRIWTRSLVLIVVLGLPGEARAADGSGLTPLTDPPPVVVVLEHSPPLSFYRPSRWEVWQYYAVDRTGHFRPRVALGAGEPFYLYNGAAYPYLPVQPRVVMPYVFD